MNRFLPVFALCALMHHYLPAAVEAPGALVAEALSGDSIQLTWVDNASGETGYTIERSVDHVHWHAAGSVGAEVETWTDSGLDAGRLYLYRVRPTDDDSAWSNWNYAVTLYGVAADSAPDPCNVRQEPDGTVVVTWVDCFHDEDGFSIERKLGTGDYEEVHIAAADTSSWTDTSAADLSPGACFYRVRVLKDGVDNADVYTSTMQGVSWVALGDPAAAVPTGLAASAVQATRIELGWDAVADAESYAVEVSYDDGLSFKSLATDLTDTDYAHTGVEYGMAYRYRVSCTTAEGTSRPSAAVSCTPAIRQDLAPPNALEATETTEETIDLAWTDNADNETGYAVERKKSSTFERIATLAANATTYNDPDGKTSYYYRVQALSDSGDSAYSNVVKADSNIEVTPPTGLSVTLSGTDGAELSWTVGSGYQDQAVQRAVGAEGDFKVIAYRTSNETSYTDWGLERDTTYRYRIVRWRHPGTESGEVSLVVPANDTAPTIPWTRTAPGSPSPGI
ncbi:MAG: fibronectin type III domain-containing protein [Planctomycetota bacterium]